MLALAFAGFACSPTAPPPWLITRPTELAVQTDIIEYGPYGDPPAEGEPSFSEVLPLDTARFTPFFVDTDGPIDPVDLDVRWVACEVDDCVGALSDVEGLESCGRIDYLDVDPCLLGKTGVATMELADLPLNIEDVDPIALAQTPAVAMIGTPIDGRGAPACSEALDERTDLDGCLSVIRRLDVGPFSGLVDALATRGIDVTVEEPFDQLLFDPRNHNPVVDVLNYSVGDGERALKPGEVATVTAGQNVRVWFDSTRGAIDQWERVVDGEIVEVQEELLGRWSADVEVADFDEDIMAVTWRANTPGERVTFYFVLEDSGGSESWGWVSFDVAG